VPTKGLFSAGSADSNTGSDPSQRRSRSGRGHESYRLDTEVLRALSLTQQEVPVAEAKSAAEPEKRFIHAPIEAIYRAFVEPTTLHEWLKVDLDLVLELDGKYCVTDKSGLELQGTIVIVAWPEALSVAWGSGRFDLTLKADFGGTSVTLATTSGSRFDGALEALESYLARPGRR
jgi:hypothetical protein